MIKFTTYRVFLEEAKGRRKLARKLVKSGLSYAEVGKHLGVTRQRVYGMMKQD